jgi:hypothetical protein
MATSEQTTAPNKPSNPNLIWLIGTLTILVPLAMLVDNKILTVASYFITQGLWIIIQTLTKQPN